jgi:glucan phosphoethanolaminetransferase (alkaline phosphatase superfamily)
MDKNIAERKPIAHFFVKKQLQIRMIVKIIVAVLITTITALLCMFIVYFVKYNTVVVYQLDKITQDLSREHIFFLILPAFLFSAMVNIVVATGLGIYASRKYAIPIYKLEQWCSLLLKGKLTAMLQFREKEEMRELSTKCNELTHFFRERLYSIKKQVEELKKTNADLQAVKNIEKSLEGLDLATEPIEVNTGYYKMALTKEKEKKV